jgi:NAD(P)-dependent dehydrogenase (short-subunit alcohol dehydrogenase family)
MEFQDRSVLVTGAAGGIGRATAVQFAREGARLTLSDRDTVRGEETLSAVRAVGGTAQFIHGDVVSEPFVQHLVDAAVKTYGRLDCAFNNAGIIGSETTAVDQFSLETWQNVLAVNLTSVFLCLKYEARAMLRTGRGAIVNTSSALVPTIVEARVPPILELRVERRASAHRLSLPSSDSGY